MIYPKLNLPKLYESTVRSFGGINLRPACPENCFFDTFNMTSSDHPVLSTRKKRKSLFSMSQKPSAISTVNGITYTIGSSLYYNGVMQFNGLKNEETKQIVSMGSINIVFPDAYYINTLETDSEGICTDYGYLGLTREYTDLLVPITPCTSDDIFPVCSTKAPSNPKDQSLWLDTTIAPNKLYIYSDLKKQWVNIAPTHIRIDAYEIDKGIEIGDSVEITGLKGYDGIYSVDQKEKNCIVIPFSQSDIAFVEVEEGKYCYIKRTVPAMDFVCEHQNRLFGCRYGKDINGNTVNEIYSSKLGDPKNWNSFQGLSTDSYTVSCGSEGEWTGIVSFMGNLLVFKENRIHRLMGNKPSNYTLYEDNCPGVKKNSERSLSIHQGYLYYHSIDGIYRYSGGIPQLISDNFGDKRFLDAVGNICRNTYYLCVTDNKGDRSLYVYDIKNGIWHRDSEDDYVYLASLPDNVLGVRLFNKKYWFNLLISDNVPTICKTVFPEPYTEEYGFTWHAESGFLGLNSPDHKYLTKIKLRFWADESTSIGYYYKMGDAEHWEEASIFIPPKSGTFSIDFNAPRCDRFRFKLEGIGPFKLYSLTKVLEKASEVN